MKKSEFENLKPGTRIYRTLDVGTIRRTIKSAYTSDFGLQFVLLEGDTAPRLWTGIYKNFHLKRDGVDEKD